ncbi:MAG: bifunctional oligoribonuclease/PAP phosphatase NrnA [Candidatus Limivivens sp.]|nr:bifunctional oligoribonuclease/PAP phosphatase NrnA [Candidatus Limivivens sp.]
MLNLERELKQVSSAAIAGHVRPDGDCVGSCMGLYLYIKKNFPQISRLDVYLEEIPEAMGFLKDTDQIKHAVREEEPYDLFLALDCGDSGRLGEAEGCFKQAKRTICIDHHISNTGYADENYIVPEASSTSELVYDLLDPEKLTREMAEALYMGIAHDTGVFQYSCCSPKTMETAGKLMAMGIDFTGIVDRTFYQKSYLQLQILGRALLESMMLFDGRCIVSVIRNREMKFYNVGPADLDGIVSQLRNTKGVEVAIFIYETNVQEYKVSMRSNSFVDVSRVAAYFGGGGHVRAAGCTMHGSPYDVLNNLTKQIEKQFLQQSEQEKQQ